MHKSPKKVLPFHAGLLTFDYFRFPEPPYKGNGWHFDMVLPAIELSLGSVSVDGNSYPAKEVMIWANSEVIAQRAADLCDAGRLLVAGSNALSNIYPGEHPPIQQADRESGPKFDSDELESGRCRTVMTSNIPLACQIAARASRRLQYAYALAKLRLSFETVSLPSVELDPSHSANVPKSPFPEDHVRLAFAIVTAWSCIEELGFEIRASSNKPSKLPNGSWNPIVRHELETRLRRGHINLKESFYWNLRGPKTRIENKRTPTITQQAPWARYPGPGRKDGGHRRAAGRALCVDVA